MTNLLHNAAIAIASDFDGTISLQDSNDLLFQLLGTPKNHEIERQYRAGAIGTRRGIREHFEALAITQEVYIRFVLSHIYIDDTFPEFYQTTVARGILFSVVSAGFHNAISVLLARVGLYIPTVFANILVEQEGRLSVKFLHDVTDCDKPYGICGNCKRRHVNALQKQGKTVVFIGDGLTDRCAAQCADVLFAKKELAAYCDSTGIPYINYSNFRDVGNVLFAPTEKNGEIV